MTEAIARDSRSANVATLVSCSYLAVSLTYAHFAGGAYAAAWEQVMLPTMVGEYVLALAILMTLRARERSGEAASASRVAMKSAVGIAVFLLPFLAYVVFHLWKAATLTAVGYVAVTSGRLWHVARAPKDDGRQ